MGKPQLSYCQIIFLLQQYEIPYLISPPVKTRKQDEPRQTLRPLMGNDPGIGSYKTSNPFPSSQSTPRGYDGLRIDSASPNNSINNIHGTSSPRSQQMVGMDEI